LYDIETIEGFQRKQHQKLDLSHIDKLLISSKISLP